MIIALYKTKYIHKSLMFSKLLSCLHEISPVDSLFTDANKTMHIMCCLLEIVLR